MIAGRPCIACARPCLRCGQHEHEAPISGERAGCAVRRAAPHTETTDRWSRTRGRQHFIYLRRSVSVRRAGASYAPLIANSNAPAALHLADPRVVGTVPDACHGRDAAARVISQRTRHFPPAPVSTRQQESRTRTRTRAFDSPIRTDRRSTPRSPVSFRAWSGSQAGARESGAGRAPPPATPNAADALFVVENHVHAVWRAPPTTGTRTEYSVLGDCCTRLSAQGSPGGGRRPPD